MDSIRHDLRDYILTQLLSGEDPSRLHDHDPLIESGVLDSLALVHLISFIDQRFAIQVPPEAITEEHFGSIAALTRFLAGCQTRTQPGGPAPELARDGGLA